MSRWDSYSRWLQLSYCCSKRSVAQDAGAETPAALQGVLDTGGNRLVHPVAGAALLGAFKLDTLECEASADPLIQVCTGEEDVAPEDPGRKIGPVEILLNSLVDMPVEEGDLALVVFLVIVVAVTDDSGTGDTVYFRDAFDRVFESAFAVTAAEVVSAGNVDGMNLYGHERNAFSEFRRGRRSRDSRSRDGSR